MPTMVERNKGWIHAGKEPPIPRSDAYRVAPTGDEAIRATVSGKSAQAVGDVLDLNLEGARVLIVLDHNPTFAVREKVTLTLASKGKKSVQVEAIVQAREELDGFRRFGFSFSNPTTLRAQLDAGLLRLFNERQSFRVAPSAKVPVAVQLKSATFQATGRMRDISADGMGVALDGDSDKSLSDVLEVSVEFLLPGQQRPVALQAWIRKRVSLDDQDVTCYGLAWDPTGSSDFAVQRDQVTDYVMARQREMLQARVGT